MVFIFIVTMVTISAMEHTKHSKLIDEMGGTVKVARLCNVSSQAVSKWRNEGIPSARLMYLKLLFPDLLENSEEAA